MSGRLIIEDGTILHGESFGAGGTSVGEIVFNTSMAGYQEVLTDPSYAGQIVLMTYPLMGNYGVNSFDLESGRPHVRGFLVREWCRMPSHWQMNDDLDTYLKKENVIGLSGLDTRALTRRIRINGTVRAVLTTEDIPAGELLARAQSWNDRGLVPLVTSPGIWEMEPAGEEIAHLAVIDFGGKKNILRSLSELGCRLTVFPYGTSADEIIRRRPDGLLLTNGPGDPLDLQAYLPEVRRLAEAIPTFGICLGHQILGMAFGGKTYKMKYGHHGINHPVKNLRSGKVTITSQNHGYALDPANLPDLLEITHVNLNDQTVEGVRHKELPVFSVQYHPEACPGPEDSHEIFRAFLHETGISLKGDM